MPSLPSISEPLRPRNYVHLITEAANQVSLVSLYSLLILSTSVFIYITIYNIYVPVVQHTRPVHLQFDTTCQENCSNPYAIVHFNDVRSSFFLARGQSYRFVIALEMPESDVNWEQGMFMIRLRLIESQGKTLYDISRPAILKYKTLLTRLLNALVYSPLHITNYKNEMQTMNVQLIDNYIEGARFYFNKMDRALVEILARDVQIYSASLHVLANLSGLSYYMYHWPISSALLGVATLASFMTILSVYRTSSSSSYQTVNYDQYTDTEERESQEGEADSSSGEMKVELADSDHEDEEPEQEGNEAEADLRYRKNKDLYVD